MLAVGALAVIIPCSAGIPPAQNRPRMYPAPVERDFIVHDFKFASGDTLPDLNLHCTTIGQPHKDPRTGKTDNAVLIMHGTGGSGHSFLVSIFADVLFGPGELLDAAKHFIILPDAIGHGHSSKPSEGLHAKFPNYRYHDIVRAQHQLIFENLGVSHLRLVMGTSMGGMQTWMWGEMYPKDMDALMPLACAPIEIAGRNRMTRQMAIDAIRTDPEWMGGEYKTRPRGLTTAIYALILMGSSPLQMLKHAPTGEAAKNLLEQTVRGRLATTDANDFLYQFEASQDYNAQPDLEKIVAPLTAVNSADDYINPPELGVVEREIKRVKNGKFVMLRGHGTHTIASIWKSHLQELWIRSGG
ncbi:MAG: alpha/beta fold hydrolase [Fimbriimonadales bacterium]